MNTREALIFHSEKFKDKPAFIFRDQPISFSQLKDISFRLANVLIAQGIKKGDKIATYLPNWPEFVYSYLACWSCGATIVPLDFMLTDEELSSCISHAEAKILIAKSKANVSFDKIRKNCPSLKDIVLCQEKLEGCLFLEDLLKNARGDAPDVEIKDSDFACIFYTSGTTGKPKGVLCNYGQVFAPALSMPHFAGLNDKDIALCALPLSHLGGLVFIQSTLFLGDTTVLMERFIPAEFLKNIQNYKISSFWLVPPMYYAILQLKEFELFDLSSVKWMVTFGAPGSMEQIKRFHQYCPNAKLINGWGMTETQGPTATNFLVPDKLYSIGKCVPWAKIKVVDDDDRELPAGQIGEIVIKGWIVTDGYYKDPETTALAIRDGWLYTGDLGKFDADGDLFIMGRKKEMIKVAGEIVFEPEVEAAIHRHPDIAEVAVVGVADKLRGEVPKAYVVLKEESRLSEEDLRYFLRQSLAHFKIPHYFEFSGSLPKNRAGKIDKASLRSSAV